MNREEYIDLFHRAEVNLVAFKQVNDCDAELRKMVEMAIEAEREACAQLCEEWLGPAKDREIHIAAAIRARGQA